MSLASRLTDEDLGAMLNCIYAKGQLKRLNLTYCFQLVGHGLEPLRGSTVLEKVDLGLVRHYEVPQAVDDARLSDEVVYEIFNDIVEGGSFERLQLPLAWSWYYVYNRERLSQFVDRHNLAFLVEDNLCAYFGFTEVSLIEHLTSKKNTDLIDECIGCFRTSEFRGCTHCNEIACIHCDEHVYACDDCAMVSCDSCRNDDAQNTVHYCNAEGHYCEPKCGQCRYHGCCNGTIDCDHCKSIVFDSILEEWNQKQAEIEQTSQVCRQQQTEIEQLRLELSQLRAGEKE